MKIILFTFLGVVLAVVVLAIIIMIVIRVLLDANGFKGQSLMSLYREAKKYRMLDKSRIKNVSGMTNVLLPTIKKYFDDFNEQEMYLYVETSIRKILEALEKRKEDLLKEDSFDLIRDKIILEIRNLNQDDIVRKYHDIVFHKHAIKDFRKDNGKAVITISTSLEYYFEEMHGDEVFLKDDYKKQTRYQTEFVYIYDIKKAGYDIKTIGLNCPNCGSPVNGYSQKICSYCKTGIDIKALDFKKCWRVVNFKEEY